MYSDTINGIPRVDLQARPLWKRNLSWAMGGPLFASKKGLALWARVAAPLEAPLMNATGGRVRLAFSIPIVVLTSVGARSGQRRDNPLAYFTDGDDVVLIASNSGGARHPAWYHNLLAHPECELHIGQKGGSFMAREVEGPERDRLYVLAVERLAKVFALHEKRCGSRTIPVMRLTPEGQ
jgi:deazaflavin-dependent oxidoreductase (nitroreductase family)